MYAGACLAALVVCIVLITGQNAPYFAHGHYLHLLPMLAVCWVGWSTLREAGPARTSKVFWTLVVTAVLSAWLELRFGIYKRKPFDEDGVFTLLSFCQLLLTACTSFAVWLRRRGPDRPRLRDDASIWAIMGAGFVYLAADEEMLLHEGAGHDILKIFHLPETAWTGRFDDMLIGVYGIIGLVALWRYRRELLRLPVFIRMLACGFVLLFLSVAADMFSHKPDFAVRLFGPERGLTVYDLGEDLDEIFKVAAEVFFLTGFTAALGAVRGEARRPPA